MTSFVSKMIDEFFIAFGVVIGGCILAGIAAVITLKNPTEQMELISENIKIWAVVVAVGGTIDPIRSIQSNFLDGQISPAIKQILYILAAYLGAHLATTLIQWIAKGGVES
ncbi:sporulation protein [Paenibacillus albiflavus]|uniref:Sporulation protein n=1 Tax=Paenibacillus albiflavus TaxID=2545760 RepID=A0A4V2WNF7_9BACL|nr:YtrH family sporulation protein [Paenibacillus albiflavus]TCZ75312.1 sporulation protein [Paenibacillus albiflavus]